MKKSILVLIIGWFFAFQAPYEDGVFMSTVVGPFKSEQACKAAYDEAKGMLEGLGANAKLMKCQFKQEL